MEYERFWWLMLLHEHSTPVFAEWSSVGNKLCAHNENKFMLSTH